MVTISNIDAEYIGAKTGYSDEKLEMLCKIQSRSEAGIVPWSAWESENSSFGKTFRKWARYPRFLPLCFISDHGVQWGGRCWPNEIKSKFRVIFTWNGKKHKTMLRDHGKKAYHVPHPWVFYRSKFFTKLPKFRSGTLVFYPHSNNTNRPIFEDLNGYIGDLKSLPDKYQPVSICLMSHDINKGLHKDLRKYDIPLVTAGITNSEKFVDRFYTLLYQFRYASSPTIGSHTYYILEAGVPFFLYGPRPKYQIKGSKYAEDGEPDLRNYGDEEDLNKLARFEKLLSERKETVTQEQYAMVSSYLGMDSSMTRTKASIILWRELFMNFGEVLKYIPIVFGRFISVFSKASSTETKS